MNEAIQKILEEFAEYVMYGEENIKKRYNTKQYEAQKIQKADKDKGIEDVYKKFARMQNINYWGYDREAEYYKQAKFIEDVEDNFTNPKRGFREDYYYWNDGSYPRFNLNDFRLYITWRTKVLKGIMEQTNHLFPKIYINELLNQIHCQNTQEAIDKMLIFWKGYRNFDRTLDYKMNQAIKEFYVIYDLEEPFEEIEKRFPNHTENKNRKDTIEVKNGNYHHKVKWISNISNYKIGNSKFLESPYGYMLDECLEQVLQRFHRELNKNHLFLQKMLITKRNSIGYTATPLSNYCVYIPEQKEKQIEIDALESYSYQKNTWKKSIYVANDIYKPFFTYIVKNMECYIRKYTGFRPIKKMEKEEILKYCDTYYYSPAQENVLQKIYKLDLEQILKEVVMEYLRNSKVESDVLKTSKKKEEKVEIQQEPLKIEFHTENFADIRKKAEETQKSLIIEEEEIEEKQIAKTIPEPIIKPKQYDNIYKQFVESLSIGEKEIIKQCIEKKDVKQTIEKVAKQNTMMQEMLISSINDKALESIRRYCNR